MYHAPALGFSLFLIALGAILTWGITVSVAGLNIDAIGVILMITGFVGLVLSLLLWTSWAPFNRADGAVPPSRRTTRIEQVEDDRPHAHLP